MSNDQISNVWTPPEKVDELYSVVNGTMVSSINAPTAGPRVDKDIPVGNAPFQLYSLATPNGRKVGIMLEELGIDYDAHTLNIGAGDQFTSGFVAVNPNSKIPAAVDKEGPDGKPINLFESASIVLYLAEKYNRFLPTDPRLKTEVMNWLFWQMGGQGPNSGAFAHFLLYAPDRKEVREYGVARYGMEVQRLCSVLDRHLAGRTYMVGEEYTIADMIIFPYFHGMLQPHSQTGFHFGNFLNVKQYTNVIAWSERIAARPAVQRGVTVCKPGGPSKPWLVDDSN